MHSNKTYRPIEQMNVLVMQDCKLNTHGQNPDPNHLCHTKLIPPKLSGRFEINSLLSELVPRF